MNGGTVFPIGWFWERIAEPNGLYNYFAMGLLSNFVFYLLGPVVETMSWFYYLNNTDIYFAAWWFSTIGYWNSILGLCLPWIFMAVYIDETLDGITSFFPGLWAVLFMVMTLVMWILSAVIHYVYVPDFMLHVAALKKPACICSLPFVDPALEKDSEEKKAAVFKANEERVYLCSIECPFRVDDCPLSKGEGQSDEDYEAACVALAA